MDDSRYNLKLVKAFWRRAKVDLKDARLLLDAGDYAGSAYFAQQSSEKIVKCVLIINNKFERTHIVSVIFAEVVETIEDEWKEKLEELIMEIRELEEHWILPRYPEPLRGDVWNPLEGYKKEDSERAIKKAEIVFDTLTKFMKEIYGVDINENPKKN